MSVSGLCEICAQGEVQWACDRCGKLVCKDHYERESGLCVECGSEVRRPGKATSDNEEWRDGVDTYRMD